jgi:hypothetical protein
MENELPENTVKACSFCERERKDTAFMCYGDKGGIAICNYCLGACLKAAGDYVVNNFISGGDNGK